MARQIKSVVRPEWKWRDNILAPTTISNTTPTVYNFVNIPAGSTVNEREGNKVLFKSMITRLEITGGESCRIRFIVLRDKRRSYNSVAGTMPNVNALDILANLTYPIISPRQLNQSNRFQILKDIVINYDHDDFGKHTHRWYWKFRHTLNFPDAATSDPNEGAVYFVAICDASTAPSFTVYNRLRWIDS